jgi:hexosaminidase
VVNSQVSQGITVNAPAFLTICGSAVSGPAPTPSTALSVANAAVPVSIGDPATGCAGNRFAGDVKLTSNLAVTFGANTVSGNVNVNSNGPGNTVIKANTIYQALACARNNPPPTNAGQPNTAASKTGQCVGV